MPELYDKDPVGGPHGQISTRPHVLIVDDSRANLTALEASLEPLDVTVDRATSGEKALRCLLEREYAVVLMDVQMPGMDGFQTARFMRERESSMRTPIIFLTAYDESHTRAFHGYAIGAVDYMSKPYDPEILRAKVGIFVELFRGREEVQRKSEELSEANRKLKDRTADLEAFTYSLSHDLRSPLRTIHGFSSLLEQGEGEVIDEEKLSYLVRIKGAAERMSHLIEDMLTLSRASHGEMVVRTVDISRMAHEIVDDLRTHYDDHEVRFSVDDGLQCTADPGLMRIALYNLLDNAWKFTRKVARPAVSITGRSVNGNGSCRLVVSDNGSGFDRKQADGLFQPFRRFHSSRDFAGTGIGLAIVRRVVLRHNGSITLQSEEGKGTRVTLSI